VLARLARLTRVSACASMWGSSCHLPIRPIAATFQLSLSPQPPQGNPQSYPFPCGLGDSMLKFSFSMEHQGGSWTWCDDYYVWASHVGITIPGPPPRDGCPFPPCSPLLPLPHIIVTSLATFLSNLTCHPATVDCFSRSTCAARPSDRRSPQHRKAPNLPPRFPTLYARVHP